MRRERTWWRTLSLTLFKEEACFKCDRRSPLVPWVWKVRGLQALKSLWYKTSLKSKKRAHRVPRKAYWAIRTTRRLGALWDRNLKSLHFLLKRVKVVYLYREISLPKCRINNRLSWMIPSLYTLKSVRQLINRRSQSTVTPHPCSQMHNPKQPCTVWKINFFMSV